MPAIVGLGSENDHTDRTVRICPLFCIRHMRSNIKMQVSVLR